MVTDSQTRTPVRLFQYYIHDQECLILDRVRSKNMLRFQSTPLQTPRNPHRGAASVWAIVCLVLVTAVALSLAKMAIAGSRHMIQERRRVQADWLVQSGWSLALSQLRQNPAYTGENWEIPAAELGGADPGRIKIEVTAPAADATDGKHKLRVIGEFPANSDRHVRVTREGTWKVPAKP